MKTCALLLVVASLSSAVTHAVVNSVPRCIRTKKLKDDGRYLTRDSALCDAPFALGISNDGTFGLWRDEDIVQVFAVDASFLQVTDSNGEAHVSVYNDDKSLIW